MKKNIKYKIIGLIFLTIFGLITLSVYKTEQKNKIEKEKVLELKSIVDDYYLKNKKYPESTRELMTIFSYEDNMIYYGKEDNNSYIISYNCSLDFYDYYDSKTNDWIELR